MITVMDSKIKSATLLLLIALFLFSCSNSEGEREEELPTSLPVVSSPQPTTSQIIQPNSKSNIQHPIYVTAKNGLVYREAPNINAKKLGTFDHGAKLKAIEKSGNQFEITDEDQQIKGEWIKVINLDRNLINPKESQTGYVFDGFTVDSLNADFSKLPTYYRYAEESKMPTIEIQELKLKFSNIEFSEFNKYRLLNDERNKNTEKVEPLKTVGSPEKGGYFLLPIDKKVIKFPCGNNYYRPCFVYDGYIKQLNAYIIGRYGESIYEGFFIDKNNASSFSPMIPYDNGNFSLHISPSDEKMMIASSIDAYTFKEFYDARSIITIYDIKNIEHLNDMKYAYEFTTKDWEIYQIYWIDNNAFVLQVFDKTKLDENGQEQPIDLRYLKAEIQY